MTKEQSKLLTEISVQPDFIEAFSKIQSIDEGKLLLAQYGIEADDKIIEDLLDSFDKAINSYKSENLDNSLSEEDLDTVAGGVVPVAVIIPAVVSAAPYIIEGIQSIIKKIKKKK